MISPPPQQQPPNSGGLFAKAWIDWISGLYGTISALQRSGSTAKRPATGLWTGRPYYDTTLNKPIWWNGTAWKDATGTTV